MCQERDDLLPSSGTTKGFAESGIYYEHTIFHVTELRCPTTLHESAAGTEFPNDSNWDRLSNKTSRVALVDEDVGTVSISKIADLLERSNVALKSEKPIFNSTVFLYLYESLPSIENTPSVAIIFIRASLASICIIRAISNFLIPVCNNSPASLPGFSCTYGRTEIAELCTDGYHRWLMHDSERQK